MCPGMCKGTQAETGRELGLLGARAMHLAEAHGQSSWDSRRGLVIVVLIGLLSLEIDRGFG